MREPRALKLSVAGVRGIVGDTLTPAVLVNFAQAFGTYVEGGTVLLSRDTRRSGEMVSSCVIAGLMGAGCQVIDLGVCPTAALQLAVKQGEAAGGIAVTAGHNDERWNALKFVREDGIFLNPRQSEELLDIYHQGEFEKAPWDRLRPLQSDRHASELHLGAVMAQVDTGPIRQAQLKVAVDCVNGACSEAAPQLLRMLGCEVVPINVETSLPFPHPPEPTLRNLAQLRALVQASGAAIGFAHDADGDRLGVVCGTGAAPGEELTICLAAEMLLQRGDPGPVVTNLCTTMRLRDIAARYGRELIETRVGQAYISESALNYAAAAAGEGSGGVIFPRINYAHDSIAAMAHILQFVACAQMPVCRLVAETFESYHMVKAQVNCPTEQAYSVLEAIRGQSVPDWAQGVDLTDGLKVWAADRWVYVRVSLTEPIIRIMAEATEERVAEELARDYAAWVRQARQGVGG